MTSRPVTITPLEQPFDAAFTLPGSKSHANRAIIAACLTNGTTVLKNATPCDDVALLVENVQKMGFKVQWIDRDAGILKIMGGLPTPVVGALHATPLQRAGMTTLDCGNAGTTLRFLTALACVTPGEWIVTGNERMQKRPIGDLTSALRMLGAEIEDNCGYPPLRIRGSLLPGGAVTLDASRSSQFLSALLLIAPVLKNGLTVKLTSTLTSSDYITLTKKVMRDFGVKVEHARNIFHIRPTHYSLPTTHSVVEGDWSASGAFLVLQELTSSRIAFSNLHQKSSQADAKLPVIIQKLRCTGKRVIDGSQCPDQVMNIAVLAAHRHGQTVIQNIGNLRIKECDRLMVITRELRKAGVDIKDAHDSLTIRGSAKLRAVTLNPEDDHRMAMAFAILGSMHSGIRIQNPDCVRKSYPAFFQDLKKLQDSPRCVAIIGMRGAGKSTLGKNLARKLHMHHIDIDDVFIKNRGDIGKFVKKHGWAAFRRDEEQIIQEALAPGRIISLGGGAIESASTRKSLMERSVVVWLKPTQAELIARLKKLGRPPLTKLPLEEEVKKVLKKRTPLYASVAQITVPETLKEAPLATLVASLLQAKCSW